MAYKRRNKQFEANLCKIADRKQMEERTLKSAWHLLIAATGCFEFKVHKSVVSKVLAVGLVAFHLDAAVFDWLDKPTTLQRILRKLRS